VLLRRFLPLLLALLLLSMLSLGLRADAPKAAPSACATKEFPSTVRRGQVWQGTVKTGSQAAIVRYRVIARNARWYPALNGPRRGIYYLRVRAGNQQGVFYVQAVVDTGFCQTSLTGTVQIV
jgi:hypothetical protein